MNLNNISINTDLVKLGLSDFSYCKVSSDLAVDYHLFNLELELDKVINDMKCKLRELRREVRMLSSELRSMDINSPF